MSTYLKAVLTAIAGGLVYLLGGWDKLLQILIIMVCIDYGTGIIRAVINKNLNSKIGFRGILKKCCIFIMIVLTVQIEKAIGQPELLHPVVILFYISNEGISILENLGDSGIPLPDFVKSLLLALNKTTNEGKNL